MHNEERERRDNRPNSALQSAQTNSRYVEPRPVGYRAAESTGVPSRPAAASAPVKKQPTHLNSEDARRLQMNPSDTHEVRIDLFSVND